MRNHRSQKRIRTALLGLAAWAGTFTDLRAWASEATALAHGVIVARASVRQAAPRIRISWPRAEGSGGFWIYRKAPEEGSWGAVRATLPADATQFDDADVENAVWRFMCMVRSVGLEKAQAEMLKIGDDRRVPMRNIYELYRGKTTPEAVLAAAVKGEPGPELKSRQLFYAHLYLGIWFDLLGERAKALDHLNKATDDHRIDHYMWDVARVHRDRLAAR